MLALSASIGVISAQAVAHDQDVTAPPVEVKSPAPGTLPPVIPLVEDKRVFGVLPNYRTAERSALYRPISPKQKMTIALKDSLDTPLFVIGATYAVIYQAENSHPEFGQGVKGYLHRLGTSYADQLIGNMFTEGLFPIMLREDPRYFRMAEGKSSRRVLYALSRIVVTKTDSGKTIFNFAEVLGNSAAAAIGLSYYPDNRAVGDYIENVGIQCGTDAASQVLKEFWPDIKRHWQNAKARKREAAAAAAAN